MSRFDDELLASAVSEPQAWHDGWRQSFCPPVQFIGVQGHFSGNPVLPAIAQVQLGLLLTARQYGLPAEFLILKRAKFMRPLSPGQVINVTCVPVAAKAQYAVTLVTEDGKAASLVLTLKGAHET
jgi:3-hydroxyacyl-[acyl-carrier-protein] dehydratase